MKVEHIPCGSFTNESESKSIEELKKKLQGLPGEGLWILLTNLAHSVGHNVSSDEIDIIALGASGIHIIEVKHWDSQYLKSNTNTVAHEAEKLNNKVKKVASKLRQQFDLGFIEGKMLLTKGDYKCVKGQQRQTIRGIKLFGLKEWHELLELDSPIVLDAAEIKETCQYLEPQTKVPLSGHIRTFADITNLERISSESDRFHRIYKGLHSRRRDRLILHLYDLSAYDGKNPEEVSRREFDTLQRLQKLAD